jgi:hypothetical protein
LQDFYAWTPLCSGSPRFDRFTLFRLGLGVLQLRCSTRLDLELQLVAVQVDDDLVSGLNPVPAKTIRDSSFSTSRWIVRRSGRAPNSGSNPSLARNRIAPR